MYLSQTITNTSRNTNERAGEIIQSLKMSVDIMIRLMSRKKYELQLICLAVKNANLLNSVISQLRRWMHVME